jgi:hypothetical protein
VAEEVSPKCWLPFTRLYGVTRNTNTARQAPKRMRIPYSAADDNTKSSLEVCNEVGLAVIVKEQHGS